MFLDRAGHEAHGEPGIRFDQRLELDAPAGPVEHRIHRGWASVALLRQRVRDLTRSLFEPRERRRFAVRARSEKRRLNLIRNAGEAGTEHVTFVLPAAIGEKTHGLEHRLRAPGVEQNTEIEQAVEPRLDHEAAAAFQKRRQRLLAWRLAKPDAMATRGRQAGLHHDLLVSFVEEFLDRLCHLLVGFGQAARSIPREPTGGPALVEELGRGFGHVRPRDEAGWRSPGKRRGSVRGVGSHDRLGKFEAGVSELGKECRSRRTRHQDRVVSMREVHE